MVPSSFPAALGLRSSAAGVTTSSDSSTLCFFPDPKGRCVGLIIGCGGWWWEGRVYHYCSPPSETLSKEATPYESPVGMGLAFATDESTVCCRRPLGLSAALFVVVV